MPPPTDPPSTDGARLRLARPELPGGLERQLGLRGTLAAVFGEAAERPTVGRYVLLRLLGRGGMGFVHLAYDPELDRKVALKFLTAARSDEAAERLLAEARALARLHHPHVVTIHDVGTVDGHVYFAMAWMPGGDLRRHLEAHPARHWTAVVDLYLQAIEGLAAAHAAGVLHRDVKPDNLFVDADGRVAVGDFGLATSADARPEEGVTAGTPVYMSPEQRAGRALTPASDQFSLAVSLAESLRALPGGPPPALARVLQRATADDPAQRFPDLRALAAALRRVRTQGRRRAWLAAGGVAAVALVAGTVAVTRDLAGPGAACREGAALGDRLDPARLAPAFARHPGGAETLAAIAPALDRYGAAWSAAWVEACDATWTRGAASPALLDLTTACLATRRAQAEALLDALLDADAARVDAAPQAVADLPDLEPCQRPDELLRAAPGPDVPETARAALAALEDEVARTRAVLDLGQDPDVPARAAALVDRAAALGHAPTRARASLLQADAVITLGLDDPEPPARAALSEALRGRADREAFDAALLLAHAAFAVREDDAEAATWHDAADALADRLELGPSWRARADLSRGYAAMYAMDYAVAEAAMRRALERVDDDPAPTRLRAGIRAGLGSVLDLSGRPEEAVAVQQLAVDELIAVSGPDNGLVHTLRGHLATALLAAGRRAEARALYDDLLARAARFPDNRDTVALRLNLAEVEREEGRLDAAEALLRGVLASLGEPPVNPRHAATAWYNLAAVHERQGRYEDMLVAGERARARVGDDPADALRAARDALPVGVALHHLGRPGEARAVLLQAVDALRDGLGPDHPDAWDLLDALARVALDGGRPAEGRAWAAEAARALPPGVELAAALTALREAEAHAALGEGDAARAALARALLPAGHPEVPWRGCLARALGLPAPGWEAGRAVMAESASVPERARAARCGR